MTWTIDDLRRLDAEYAKAGVHLHQRPFRAAMDLLGPNFIIGVGENPEIKRIATAYRAMLPETDASWPGLGIGLVAVVDQVRKVVAPVALGRPGPLHVWAALGFHSETEWWLWCREDRDLAAETSFAFGDLWDFSNGVSDLRFEKPDAQTLWRMAQSNLGDTASILPTASSVDSVIQPICMVVELSLKAALVFNGAKPESFKGKDGHDLKGLARRLKQETPHRDDALMTSVVTRMPPYVQSRYAPAGLSRMEVVRLALAAQFVAASTVRRFSQRDLASQMESGPWPAPRRPFFV